MTLQPTKTLTLLLVEDEKALQTLLEIELSDEGFEVVLARNGAEGIAELNNDGARFRALITDIRLGAGPTGWDVGHRAREVVSGMPVIYMSGNSAHEWSANGVPESVMLEKPFVMAQLVAALTTLLNQASRPAAPTNAMTQDKKRSSD